MDILVTPRRRLEQTASIQRHSDHVCDLIRLRRNWFNSTAGLKGQSLNVFHVNDAGKVVAFHRWDRGGMGDDVVVVIKHGEPIVWVVLVGFPRAGLWHVRFNSDWNVTVQISRINCLMTLPPSTWKRRDAVQRQYWNWSLRSDHSFAGMRAALGSGPKPPEPFISMTTRPSMFSTWYSA